MNGFLYWSAYTKICETLHMDAAPGRLMNGDANGCGNALAAASRDARATPELFVDAVNQFLSTADARTCTVFCEDPAYRPCSLGFETRRHGDFLYVTAARQEARLRPGMRIVAVGRNTVPFLLKDTAQEIFWGRGGDREDWDLALRMFDDIDVFPGDGRVERLDLRRYPLERPEPRFSCERAGEAAVLTVGSLEDPAPVEQLAGEARAALAGAHRLVVDLRACPGEADPASYLALLPFLCDRGCAAREVFGDIAVRTIYSKANADLLLQGIARAQAQLPADDGQTRAALDALAADVRAKADGVLAAKRSVRGLQARRTASEVPEVIPAPFSDERVALDENAPARAILLVGPGTGVGAERLAQAVRGMEKVALAGRATPGAVDYANYVTLRFPEIGAGFTYPIARTEESCAGRGLARTGLPLDLHVPWTPAECTRDLVLERALEL